MVQILAPVILAACFLSDCSQPTNPGAPAGNQPPRTRLANVPVNDSTGRYPSSNPTVALYWIGDDVDGYVTAFRYRWSYRQQGVTFFHDWTTILNFSLTGIPMAVRGSVSAVPAVYQYFAKLLPASLDSTVSQLENGVPLLVSGDTVLAADKAIINPNKGVFIFESKDTLNPHTFEVKAVDNLGAEDPNPPSVTFWTPQALPPVTVIDQPYPPDSTLMIDHVTDTYPGLTFYFEGIDRSSKSLVYSWTVDSVRWSPYSTDQQAIVTASDLRPPYTGVHTFYVKARNDYGLEDPTPASRQFSVIVPTFTDPSAPHRILVLDDTRSGTARRGFVVNTQVDTFYQALFTTLGRDGTYDLWNVKKSGFPTSLVLSRYNAVVFANENYRGENPTQVTTVVSSLLSSYLSVGGKMIISSWQLPNLFSNPDSFFVNNVHAQTVREQFLPFPPYTFYHVNNYSQDFIGATGALGYPDVIMDTTKMDTSWHGGMEYMAFISPRGFAEVIYTYNSKTLDRNFQGRSSGLRYLGLTYSVVYFGFPLYYAERQTAPLVLQKAFQDIGE